MSKPSFKSVLRSTLALSALLAAEPALAQSINNRPPPDFSTTDANGVDLVTGSISTVVGTLSIGPEEGGLAMSITQTDGANPTVTDSLIGGIKLENSPAVNPLVRIYTVTYGGQTAVFTRGQNSSSFFGRGGHGGKLELGAPGYIYTAPDGTKAYFDSSITGWSPEGLADAASLKSVVKPNGETLTYHYVGSGPFDFELRSVTNNLGYQIHYGTGGIWGVNNAVDACAPTAATCSFTQDWPRLTYNASTGAYANAKGEVRVTSPSGKIFKPGWSYGFTSIWYGESSGVNYVYDGVGTWGYSYEDRPEPHDPYDYTSNNYATDPNGQTTTTLLYWGDQRPYDVEDSWQPGFGSITDPAGGTREYWFLGNKITREKKPEGDVHWWNYFQGKFTGWSVDPKPGSGQASISSTVAYADCSTDILCSRPTSVTDPRGNVTDFTYDAAGNLLTETGPASTPGAVRPQTRHSYMQQYAWYKQNGSNAITQAPSPVWVRVESSSCATSASCDGQAQEVQTTTAYQAGSASAGSNLLPISVTTGSGDGALLATTTTTWDAKGDPLTVDGPLAGTADTTRTVTDAARQVVGVIGPDPDGSGPRAYAAVKTTYNAEGQPTAVARGTTTGQSDAAFAAFSTLQTDTSAYDARGLKVMDTTAAGTADAMVTQYGYDGEGRPTCTTQRMNPANFGSLPAACSLGTQGSHGPDRITHVSYDLADRPTETRTGYATTDVRLDSKRSYTPNGQVDWAEDGNGNRSDYTYDGFDRLTQLNFPSATVGAHAADPNLYEQYGYDAADNPVSKRTRAGEWFYTTFDALNRITFVDAPAPATTDTAFTYDLLGRRLTATQPGVQTITSAWDALGRNTTESSSLGTLTNAYDLAGRRTYRYWPNGNWVRYTWDLSDQLTQVGVNDWLTAGAMTYDNLGRRTGISRYNGVTTSYGYDAASRLTSLTHDLSGTVNDVTYGLSYIASGQIGQRTVSNSAYDWAPSVASTSYANNGLNQTTSAGGTPVSWESRGNLTSDGVRSYTYDAANRLLSGGGTGLGYDPLDRLYQHTGTAAGRFQYDGSQLAGVYDGAGTMVEHWVGGAGPDEWLALHAGGWLWTLQDHQGSVVALTDGSGVTTAINAWDEYGQPRPGNVGRMQYTGQMMLPDLGLQHDKARAYHAGLGRFMQTDPVGYEQGMNLYAYVGNDPVNAVDPSGQVACETVSTCQTYWREGGMLPSPQQAQANSRYLGPIIGPIFEGFGNLVSRARTPQTRALGQTLTTAGRELQSTTSVPSSPRTSAREGIYEFPDRANGGVPYVGQSGNIPSRLRTHERAGRLESGTQNTTEVFGGRVARERAEHARIQEITGGVPARQSSAVSNQRDPIGRRRRDER